MSKLAVIAELLNEAFVARSDAVHDALLTEVARQVEDLKASFQPRSAEDREAWVDITRWLQANDQNGSYTAELFEQEFDEKLTWDDTREALEDTLADWQ